MGKHVSHIGRKLVAVAIWAGFGILIGLQFGGGNSATTASVTPPGWTAGQETVPDSQGAQRQGGFNQQSAAPVKGEPSYVYVPMAVDPVTGAYTPLPMQPGQGQIQVPDPSNQQVSGNAGGNLTPEQILVPEGQKPTVDVLADKTAGLLQEASQKGIRWVVSLFSSAE